MIENMIAIRNPKTFCFNFGLPKDLDENLKREIEFIIKKQYVFSRDYNKKQDSTIIDKI